jgi:hypothetical protein
MQTDLHAAVRARQELELDMEEQVLESFLQRLEGRVDAMVDSMVDSRLGEIRKSTAPAKPAKTPPPDVGVIAGTMALAIPIAVVAGIFAGALGIGLVMAGVVGVILLYFIDRWATQ